LEKYVVGEEGVGKWVVCTGTSTVCVLCMYVCSRAFD